MRRRAFHIVVLLMLLGGGAIVNVAVAWGVEKIASKNVAFAAGSCPILFDDGMVYAWWRVETYRSLTRQLVWSMRVRNGGPLRNSIRRHEDFARDRNPAEILPSWADSFRVPTREFDTGGYDEDRMRIGSGFPLLTLYYELNYGHEVLAQAWVLGRLESKMLPYRPIWPGFAMNTIFYAAILWVVFFVPGMVRRRIRRRRGRCPACAYPIGTSEVCTECGNPMKVRTGMALPPPRTDEVMT